MVQMARNLTDADEPFLRAHAIPHHGSGYQIFRRNPCVPRSRADRVDTTAATLVRSVKAECTGRMVFFGRSSLERALMHYVAHYHEERNHQRLQNRLLKCSDGRINPGG